MAGLERSRHTNYTALLPHIMHFVGAGGGALIYFSSA